MEGVNSYGHKELVFRPLDTPSEISCALVWKRHAVFSRAASAFLE